MADRIVEDSGRRGDLERPASERNQVDGSPALATPAAPQAAPPAPWQALGVLALASICTLAAVASLIDRLGLAIESRRLLLAAAVGALLSLATALGIARTARRDGLAARDVPRALSHVWRRPASGWIPFLLGVLLTLPVVSLHSSVIVGDADSARILASILHVQQGDLGQLVQTQETWLSHAVLGPLATIGGIPAVQAYSVLSVLALGGVLALLAWKTTRSAAAAAATALTLTSFTSVLDRAYRLPMYPTMLALGFLGLYLAHRAMTRRGRPWRDAFLAALCLYVAIEAHQVGQLFLVATALLLVAHARLAAVPGFLRVVAAFAVLFVPRAIVNFWDGGLYLFFTNRVDFWITEGYLHPIQVQFFHLPVRLPFGEYVSRIPEAVFFKLWTPTGWLGLGLAVFGVLLARPRARRLALLAVGIMLLIALQQRLPFYTRYYLLLIAGSSIAAGIAVGALARRPSRWAQTGVVAALAGLALTSALSIHGQIGELERLQTRVARWPYEELAKVVPPGDGVTGTRALYFILTTTHVRPYAEQFLSEEEYVTLLTWPSEQAVIAVMRKHDIEWVMVPHRWPRYVVRYNNIWLLPNHGRPAVYPLAVRKSPSFCLEAVVKGTPLYRLDPNGPRGAATTLGRRCGG